MNFNDLSKVPYLVLDTETTGLRGDIEVLEIAIVRWDGEVLLNQRIKPKKPVPAEATRIHGISDADLVDCPTFPDVFPKILDIIKGQHVVVYNALYDRQALDTCNKVTGGAWVNLSELASWHCAMDYFAYIYGDWNEYYQSFRWQTLKTASIYYNVDNPYPHSAIGDALTTLELTKLMLQEGAVS